MLLCVLAEINKNCRWLSLKFEFMTVVESVWQLMGVGKQEFASLINFRVSVNQGQELRASWLDITACSRLNKQNSGWLSSKFNKHKVYWIWWRFMRVNESWLARVCKRLSLTLTPVEEAETLDDSSRFELCSLKFMRIHERPREMVSDSFTARDISQPFFTNPVLLLDET